MKANYVLFLILKMVGHSSTHSLTVDVQNPKLMSLIEEHMLLSAIELNAFQVEISSVIHDHLKVLGLRTKEDTFYLAREW